MSMALRPPCDHGVLLGGRHIAPVERRVGAWVLLATILGSSLSFIDGTVVNVALPVLQRELGATVRDVQWIVESYALFLSSLLLVGGSLGDRFGRRRIFAMGVALFTLASIGCGLSRDTAQLILARAVQGVGGALLVPGSLAIISATFDGGARGRAIGVWSAFTTVTAAAGPVLGGWLAQHASWRWIFYINVPLAAVTLFATFRHVPESCDEQDSGAIDWRGAALATVGLGGLVYGLIEASARGLADARVVAAMAAGAIALATFVVVERRVERTGGWPMVPPSLFRSRAFAGANLLTLFLYAALAGALYFVPFDLQQVQGYGAARAGAALLPMTLVMFLLSRWAGGLLPRVGARLPLVAGCVIVAAGFGLFMVPGIGGSYWSTFFPAILVTSFGLALVVAPLTTTVMNAVPSTRAGAASGINNAVSRTAGLLAIALLNLGLVAVFDRQVAVRLAALPLPAAARASLAAQREHLLAVQVPVTLAAPLQAAVRSALRMAFVGGFRIVMALAAGLALLAAAVAACTIDGRPADSDASRR